MYKTTTEIDPRIELEQNNDTKAVNRHKDTNHNAKMTYIRDMLAKGYRKESIKLTMPASTRYGRNVTVQLNAE